MDKLGVPCKGRNTNTLNNRISSLGLDTSHFLKNYEIMVDGNRFSKRSLEEVCTKNSTYNRNHLKSRLLREGLLKNECYICGQKPFWNNKPMTLIIDHINGIYNDHRIENLRIVCPNCNSQLDTHCGRKSNFCKCGERIKVGNKYCKSCLLKEKRKDNLKLRKVERPEKEVLENDLKNNSFVVVGRKYGVSDNCIRKWCKRYGII
jgi:hypothetical protein